VRSMPQALDVRPARARVTPPALGVLKSALASARLGAAGTLAGWPVLLGRGVFYIVAICVLAALWDKVAAERVPGALRLPAGGLVLYVGVTEWIMMSAPAIHLRLEDDIRSGALESHLLRPKFYLIQKVAESLGGLLARGGVIGMAGLLLLALSGRAAPAAAGFAAIAVLGLLGGTIGVLILTVAGLAAFWVRRTIPVYLILQKGLFLLGGLFAPVSLYPRWLADLSEASPFGAALYWPAVQALTPSAALFWRALGLQLVWVALLSGLAAAIWSAGLRKVLRQGV
jgi:ABC-2 type transport system permease protein